MNLTAVAALLRWRTGQDAEKRQGDLARQAGNYVVVAGSLGSYLCHSEFRGATPEFV